MKLKQISITVSRTFNLGNFESLRVEAGAVAELADAEAPEIARAAMLEEVRTSLREQYTNFAPPKK